MKKTALVTIVLSLLLAGGAWLYKSKHPADDSATSPMLMPPPGVSVMHVATKNMPFTHELPGRISPYRQSQVRPQVDGIITERLFEEGADVAKGQQLYQIDDARYKAALNSAVADLQSAKANVKTIEARTARYKELVKINAVSQQEYDDVKAQLDQANAAIAVAQAAVDVAQVNLDYTKVYAPIAGRISRSFVTEGALVTANQVQNLATITQLDPVYIDMQQSGSEAIHLRSRMMGKDGIPVTLTLDEATGKTYPLTGTLKFSEVTVDETTGAIALRAMIPNPDGVLLSGLFVRASLDLGEDDVLLVPQRAATRAPDGSLSVWVIDDNNQAQPRSIKVEQAYRDSWIVTGGLSANEAIVVEGYQKIGPGTVVVPEPWIKNAHTEKDSDKKEQE
ncbi:MAG: efflux RND transporter periplasmic adaptor subunit [Pseudomonadota bacterium]|nr:efflux RND transporter periplasmic adaptor subunit [Pseudomonadota bacterium]QKK05125.1 MAG: efflux RND transporter periplasmic adaptor subunit [Pseudomonadota bacterium]